MLLTPVRPPARIHPLGVRPGARIRWICISCRSTIRAAFGVAPACTCGGRVRPKTTR
jgi:hypothetical protein